MKKNIPFHKRRYVDYKKPIFNFVEPSTFDCAIKLERFTKKAGQNSLGFIIVVYRDDKPYSIEGQELIFDDIVRRKDSGFVDIEPTEYFKNNEREITMTGSYFHGFHYFENKEDAEYISNLLYRHYPTEVKDVFVNSNTSGEMFGVPTNVTIEVLIYSN